MKPFDLIVDKKVSVWMRSWVSIVAEDLQDAVKAITNGEYTVNDSETLYETVENLEPTKENATLEIFLERPSNIPIYTNKIR